MLTFLFAAALVVATPRIYANQMTMDAKIRDDSDLSQVSVSSRKNTLPGSVRVSFSLKSRFDQMTSRECPWTFT